MTEEPIKKPKKKNNYINNKTLYGAMIHYKNELKEAREKRANVEPEIPRYIGQSILLICNNLAKKPNFSGYTYKQDMISDGIMDCISAVDNFNPDKTNNPFAYFTQIAWNAFLRRIQKEKKQMYVKYKATEQFGILDEGELYEDSEGNVKQFVLYDNISEFIQNFEEKKRNKKKTKKGLEKFFEEEITNER